MKRFIVSNCCQGFWLFPSNFWLFWMFSCDRSPGSPQLGPTDISFCLVITKLSDRPFYGFAVCFPWMVSKSELGGRGTAWTAQSGRGAQSAFHTAPRSPSQGTFKYQNVNHNFGGGCNVFWRSKTKFLTKEFIIFAKNYIYFRKTIFAIIFWDIWTVPKFDIFGSRSDLMDQIIS